MTSSVRLARAVAPALAVATLVAGCAASPRQRPIPTSRVAESGVTLQSVRQQFEGTWTLVSLEYGSPEGTRAAIGGTMGTLTADGFGNLAIEYRMSAEGLKVLSGLGFTAPNAVVSTKGQVAIDVDQKSIAYVDASKKPFDPAVAAGRANPFALERTRYYDFAQDGMLTLTTRHDDGKDAVVSRWKKG